MSTAILRNNCVAGFRPPASTGSRIGSPVWPPAQMGKTSLPRKSATDAKREESTTEDIRANRGAGQARPCTPAASSEKPVLPFRLLRLLPSHTTRRACSAPGSSVKGLPPLIRPRLTLDVPSHGFLVRSCHRLVVPLVRPTGDFNSTGSESWPAYRKEGRVLRLNEGEGGLARGTRYPSCLPRL